MVLCGPFLKTNKEKPTNKLKSSKSYENQSGRDALGEKNGYCISTQHGDTYCSLFSTPFVTENSQESLQYVWVRSLAVSLSIVSCFAEDDNDSHCALNEIHRWHSSHSTWSICTQHSCPRHSFYSIEAVFNSWIILLFLVQEAECLWFLTRRGARIRDFFFFFCEWVRKGVLLFI